MTPEAFAATDRHCCCAETRDGINPEDGLGGFMFKCEKNEIKK